MSLPHSPVPLGRQLKIYRSQAVHRRDAWRFGLALLLPGVLLSIGVWRAIQIRAEGFSAAMQQGQLWFILAALALLPAFLLVLVRLSSARRHVFLHKNGLRLIHFSQKSRSLSWKQISGIFTDSTRTHLLGRELYTHDRLTIVPTTGVPVWIDDRIMDLPHLTAQIKARFYSLIFPEVRARLHSGQWLYFGAIRLNRQQLDAGRKEVSWSEVDEIEVRSGRLVITLVKGGRIRIPTNQIPNLELLLKLIAEDINL